MRQLLIESLMLSFAGGVLGLGLSIFGIKWFDAATANAGKPYWMVFSMDYRVFIFFLAVCAFSGVVITC